MISNFLDADLKLISDQLGKSSLKFKNKRILITGGTGFFGKWLLYSLNYLNRIHDLNIQILCTSRNYQSFFKNFPEFGSFKNITWVDQDLRSTFNFDFRPDYVFHMATDASPSYKMDLISNLESTLLGTKNLLSYLKKYNSPCKLLLTSSGAVYGNQNDMTTPDENHLGAPNSLHPDSLYGEAKRISELLCALYAQENLFFRFTVARCFAFSGPFLPLDKQFAIGNFVHNLLQGEKILINGNGLAQRSYMYGADLVIWLINILFNGRAGQSYNVGSDEAISIKELGDLVCSFKPEIGVGLKNNVCSSKNYIPNINKAKNELGLRLNYSIRDGVTKMIEFYSKQGFLNGV